MPQGLDNVTAIASAQICLMALRGDGTVVVWGYNGDHQSAVPADLGKVTAIAIGSGSSPCCLALQEDGTVSAWGGNTNGQCDVPADLAGVTAIAAGVNHCLALKEDGTVRAWGDNTDGQCDVPAGLSGVVDIYIQHRASGYTEALLLSGNIYSSGRQCTPRTIINKT